MEENQVHIPDGWKKTSFGDKEKFRIIGSGIKHFIGEKEYYSTSSIDGNKVIFAEQLITFKNRPSRANMQPIESSVWFAKMKNTFKILKAQRKEIEEVILSTGFSGIESETVDCDYLMQILSSSEFNSQKNLLAEGSTQEAVNNTKIKEIKFLLPESRQEQTTIARILSKVDEAIAQTEQLIAKYTRIKTGLMQDLLTKGIDENGNIRREETHEFKDSPLGRIPKDWEIVNTEDLFEMILGKMLNKDAKEGKNLFPYLGNKNVQWGKFDLVDLQEMSFNEVEKLKYELNEDDLLVCEGGDVGRCAIWKDVNRVIFFQKAIHRLRISNSKIRAEYMFEYLKSTVKKSFFNDFVSQTSIKHFTQEKFKKLPILLPSIEEQDRIIQISQKQNEIISKENIHLSKLQSLKTGLMQDLLSGKVRVNHLIKETVSV
ncbi:MAG: restriction endonuclease subunit S [Mangrovibacterium sp.]